MGMEETPGFKLSKKSLIPESIQENPSFEKNTGQLESKSEGDANIKS